MSLKGRRRFFVVVVTYLCVFSLYGMFFGYPVSPAKPTEIYDFVIEDKRYSSLPYIHETIYTNGKGFLAVATIRTISAPNSAFSAAFERLDSYAEDYIKEQYGVEVSIEEDSRDEAFRIAGHTGVKFTYSVTKQMAIGFPPFETVQDIQLAELGAVAWFCNVDFESVILIYVTPLYFDDEHALALLSDQVFSMVEEVECH